MEYVLGIYLIGWVLCSLYIASALKERRDDLDMVWWKVFGVAVFTCTVWPWFLGWCIYKKWNELEIL